RACVSLQAGIRDEEEQVHALAGVAHMTGASTAKYVHHSFVWAAAMGGAPAMGWKEHQSSAAVPFSFQAFSAYTYTGCCCINNTINAAARVHLD
ncbi:unnamed protein product, partial [Closterium sp. NIES-64]